MSFAKPVSRGARGLVERQRRITRRTFTSRTSLPSSKKIIGIDPSLAKMIAKLSIKPKRKQNIKFKDKISKDVLKHFKINAVSKKEIDKHLTIEELSSHNKDIFRKALLDKDIAVELCNRTINAGFINQVLSVKNIQGLMIKFKGTPIGFNLYKMSKIEIETILICSKKKSGTLRGVPIGRFLMKMIDIIGRNNKKQEAILEAVPSAIPFYESLGYTTIFFNKRKGLMDMSKDL